MERNKKGFTELAVIPDEDGLIASITLREKNGERRLSFAIQREFERGGETERTSYLHRRHVPGAIRLIEKAAAYLEAEEDRLRAQKRHPEVVTRKGSA